MYGSTAKNVLGFRLTCDIVALICLVFGLIYFFVGDGIEAFQTTIRNFKQSVDDDNFEKVTTTSLGKEDRDLTNTTIHVPVPTSLVVSRIRHRHTSSMISDSSPVSRSRVTSAAWGGLLTERKTSMNI